MTFASLGRNEEAAATLEQATTVDLPIPPVLLIPLNWLAQGIPTFYKQYALPLVERYSLLATKPAAIDQMSE